MWKKLILVVTIAAISFGIIIAMSWFPTLYLHPAEDQRVTFVNEDNLVDLIAGVPVQMRIRKVKLNHTILSIDLIITSKTDKASVYHDLYEVAQSTIKRTTNLNRVLVRVFESDPNADGSYPTNTLLLSTDLKRNDANGLSANKFDKSSNFYRKEMESNFQIMFTPRWSGRFSS